MERNSQGGGNSSMGVFLGIGLIAMLFGAFGGVSGLLTVLGIGLGAVLIIVALVVIFAIKGSQEDAENGREVKPLSEEDAEILSDARRELLELRRLNAKIDSLAVREKSGEICSVSEKLLKAMKEDPSRIPAGQMFLQYNLPTQRSILRKYEQIEESGTAEGAELEQKLLLHLDEMKTAADNQLARIFENDFCDISAELELLSLSCREDGLL